MSVINDLSSFTQYEKSDINKNSIFLKDPLLIFELINKISTNNNLLEENTTFNNPIYTIITEIVDKNKNKLEFTLIKRMLNELNKNNLDENKRKNLLDRLRYQSLLILNKIINKEIFLNIKIYETEEEKIGKQSNFHIRLDLLDKEDTFLNFDNSLIKPEMLYTYKIIKNNINIEFQNNFYKLLKEKEIIEEKIIKLIENSDKKINITDFQLPLDKNNIKKIQEEKILLLKIEYNNTIEKISKYIDKTGIELFHPYKIKDCTYVVTTNEIEEIYKYAKSIGIEFLPGNHNFYHKLSYFIKEGKYNIEDFLNEKNKILLEKKYTEVFQTEIDLSLKSFKNEIEQINEISEILLKDINEIYNHFVNLISKGLEKRKYWKIDDLIEFLKVQEKNILPIIERNIKEINNNLTIELDQNKLYIKILENAIYKLNKDVKKGEIKLPNDKIISSLKSP